MAKPYENLKKLREEKKISVRKMASLLNTSPSQLFYLESGKISLSFEWIERFTKILNCSPADIIGYENLGISTLTKYSSIKNSNTEPVTFISSNGLKVKKIPFTQESLKALNLPTGTQLFCKKLDNTLVFLDKQDNVITTFTLPLTFKHKKSSKPVKIPASITQTKE